MPFLDFSPKSASRKILFIKKKFFSKTQSNIIVFQVGKIINFANSLKSESGELVQDIPGFPDLSTKTDFLSVGGWSAQSYPETFGIDTCA